MTSAIERAVALAERIPPAEIKKSSRQLKLVSTQMKPVSALIGKLFGIEEASRLRVENSFAVLKREQTDLQNRVTFGAEYPLLSMEPLTWRDKNGWPQLVVFSLDSPRWEMAISGRYYQGKGWKMKLRFESKMFPQLPEAIAACYEDVQKTLQRRASKRQNSAKLSCRFEGLIPDYVKQKIVEVRGSFKEMFLIAEPKGFEINETAIVVPRVDPLVVGFDGTKLWLIADFETTPVEEAMIFSLPGANKN